MLVACSFQTNPLVQPIFLLQLKKVAQKKARGFCWFLYEHGYAQMKSLTSGRRAGDQVWETIIMDVLLIKLQCLHQAR